MQKKDSLKKNAIFNAIYQVLILIVPLITTPYISRILGPDNNGIYANFYSIVQYFVLVTTFGFLDYGTKKIAENRDSSFDRDKQFFLIYFSKITLGLVCLILYISFVFVFFDSTYYLFALIFSVYILSAMIDPLFYFQGEEKYVSICIRNAIVKILSTILIFVLVKSKDDLITYTLILAISQIVSIIVIMPNMKVRFHKDFNIKSSDFLLTLKGSFSFFVPSLAVTLFSYLNQTLIGFFGNNDAESGYFSQAVKIIQILSCIPASLSTMMLSRISYMNNNCDDILIIEKIKKAFQAFSTIAWPITFGVCSIASIFIPLFLGNGYEKCVTLIYILSPTIILAPLNSLYGSLYFRPKNRIWTQTYIILFSAIINLIVCVILIPNLNSVGTSIGRIVAEFLQLPLLMFFSRKYINSKMVFNATFKPLVSSLIMFILCIVAKFLFVDLIVNQIILLITIIVLGGLSYALFEIILKDEIVISNLKIIMSHFKKNNKI